MDPLTIGLGVSALSGLATSAFNAYEQSQNRDTQVDLANTAHQREVEDLKKAGLNPILSVNRGAAVPATQPTQVDNPIPQALTSALAVAQTKSQLELQQAQTQETSARAASSWMDANIKETNQLDIINLKRNEVLSSNLDIETKKKELNRLDQEIEGIKSRNLALRYTLPGLYNEAQFQRKNPNQPMWDRVIQGGGSVINSAAQAAKLLK